MQIGEENFFAWQGAVRSAGFRPGKDGNKVWRKFSRLELNVLVEDSYYAAISFPAYRQRPKAAPSTPRPQPTAMASARGSPANTRAASA